MIVAPTIPATVVGSRTAFTTEPSSTKITKAFAKGLNLFPDLLIFFPDIPLSHIKKALFEAQWLNNYIYIQIRQPFF